MIQSELTSLVAYLDSQYKLLTTGDYWNCLKAAREVARLLLAEDRRPWIARLRKTEMRGDDVFHVPLMPRGLGRVPTWTTHYVCCCDEMAYDPVAGRPISLDEYSLEVFGQQIALEVFVSVDELPDYLDRELKLKAAERA